MGSDLSSGGRQKLGRHPSLPAVVDRASDNASLNVRLVLSTANIVAAGKDAWLLANVLGAGPRNPPSDTPHEKGVGSTPMKERIPYP